LTGWSPNLKESPMGCDRMISEMAEERIRKMVAENFDAERTYERLTKSGQCTSIVTFEDGEIKVDYVDMWELYTREPDGNGGIRTRSEYFF
jgi:hypothetical protein